MNWDKIEKLKEQGNKLFHAENYDDSLKCYKDAIGLVDSGYKSFASVHANISQAYLNKKDYSSAIEHANKSLELDPLFRKSMWRRAMANCELKNYEEAMRDGRYLFKHEPTDSKVISLMKRCSDLPKMKQELRISFVTYSLRRALYKTNQLNISGFSVSNCDSLRLALLRQLFLSLKNLDFVGKLLHGASVTPSISEVQFNVHDWFALQTVKLKFPILQRMFVLSIRMFKLIFHLVPAKSFILRIILPPRESVFGPWNRYLSVGHLKEGSAEISFFDANDLRVIEQNAEIWTCLFYLPTIVSFKNTRFINLEELSFAPETLPDMAFLKLWQKKRWPVKTVFFCNPVPKLETFKKFNGVISNHVTKLYMSFAKDGTLITKDIYQNLCNDLEMFKRVFPNLTEVTTTVNYPFDVKTFPSIFQTSFKKIILEEIKAVDHKPEWCSSFRFKNCITLYNSTAHDVKKVKLDTLKNAVESYRHELDCVKNLRFIGPTVIDLSIFLYYCSLFTVKFEKDAVDFQIDFTSIL